MRGLPVLITEHLHEVISHTSCVISYAFWEKSEFNYTLSTDKMELNSFFSYTVKKKFTVVYSYVGQWCRF